MPESKSGALPLGDTPIKLGPGYFTSIRAALVATKGIEPPPGILNAYSTVQCLGLPVLPLHHSRKLVHPAGIEPATTCVSSKCSTAELRMQNLATYGLVALRQYQVNVFSAFKSSPMSSSLIGPMPRQVVVGSVNTVKPASVTR